MRRDAVDLGDPFGAPGEEQREVRRGDPRRRRACARRVKGPGREHAGGVVARDEQQARLEARGGAGGQARAGRGEGIHGGAGRGREGPALAQRPPGAQLPDRDLPVSGRGEPQGAPAAPRRRRRRRSGPGPAPGRGAGRRRSRARRGRGRPPRGTARAARTTRRR